MPNGPIFETFLSLDEVPSPILRPTPSATGHHFVFRIELLVQFEKTNVWSVSTPFEDARIDNLYSIVTNSLKQVILVSLTISARIVFHIYPKQFGQAMHVNVVEHFIG